jgi:dTDP-4-amino-4,6-dideoxygalactose transaminase
LQVALAAIGVGPGDEVIVPAYTYIATASAVLLVNAVPVFADIDPATYCLEPRTLGEHITSNTKAILVVHYGGYPADMDAICKLADERNLKVIEDCAHAHGAVFKGRKVGTFGQAGCFSFQLSKNMASGEGGIIITNNEEIAAKCYSLSNFGRVPGRPKYDFDMLGWNYRMSPFIAAILHCQLERVEKQAKVRLQNAALLDDLLAAAPHIQLMQHDDPRVTRRAYHIYTFKYQGEDKTGVSRDTVIEALTAEGIPCATGYNPPLYRTEMFLQRNYWPKGCPVSCPFYQGTVDYAGTHLPVAERVMAKENIMLDQFLLLGSQQDTRDIARAITKVMDNLHELNELVRHEATNAE